MTMSKLDGTSQQKTTTHKKGVTDMVALLVMIPLMVAGVAIATLPVLVTMIREDKARRVEFALVASEVSDPEHEELPAAA